MLCRMVWLALTLTTPRGSQLALHDGAELAFLHITAQPIAFGNHHQHLQVVLFCCATLFGVYSWLAIGLLLSGINIADGMQGTASLWLTGRSGRLSSEATLDPSRAGEEAVTLARSDASAAEEAGFIIDAASNLAGRLRVRNNSCSASLRAPHVCI